MRKKPVEMHYPQESHYQQQQSGFRKQFNPGPNQRNFQQQNRPHLKPHEEETVISLAGDDFGNRQGED